MRYTGPKLKIVRHLGLRSLPAFTTKSRSKREKTKKKKKHQNIFYFQKV